MLIKADTLRRIASGEVTIAFRRWKRPTVKPGGTLKTPIGVLHIRAIQVVELDHITEDHATAAGYADLATLLQELAKRDGPISRVTFGKVTEDPRIALRQQSDLSNGDRELLTAKLDAFDSRSRKGPWAWRTLALIEDRPGVLAADLADQLGFEKAWFKANVRKLKQLGLTSRIPLDLWNPPSRK